jgi:hypothetical protein
MLLFFNIRPAMASKHSELMKRHAQDCYGRFASSSSPTAPPPSRMHKVRRSSRHRTAPPPSCQEEASSNDSLEMWVVCRTAPPPLRLVTPPTPPTHVEEVTSNDSLLSDSSGYNDECPHIKEVSLIIYMKWF